MRYTFISLLAISLLFLLFQQVAAGYLKCTVPTGKEISNSYLENLFAPDFPFESVKVNEQQTGDVVVAIKFKEKVSDEIFKQYYKTLEKRNISVENDWDTKHGVLISGKVLLVREVSKEPYVIEFSESFHKSKDITIGLPYNIVSKVDNYIVSWIDKDFGSKFSKIIIYPNNDTLCPLFPLVEKYPRSKSLDCFRFEKLTGDKREHVQRSNAFVFRYVSKDSYEQIRDYYRERLIKRFKEYGMVGLEKYDWTTGSAGVKVSDNFGNELSWPRWKVVVSEVKDYSMFNNMEKYFWESCGTSGNKVVLPKDGEVFKVVITRGADKWTKGFNLISVFYETDRKEIQRTIKLYSVIDKWKPNQEKPNQ